MVKKKYTEEALEFSDKLFIDNKESLEYRRLVKGLLKAAKDDIKAGKSSNENSTQHLEEFIDELFKEYQEKFPAKNQKEQKTRAELEVAQKSLVKEDLKETYSKLKNHLSEYAIWGVDNTKSETIIKSIKNSIVICAFPITNIINGLGRLAGLEKDLIPMPNFNHSIEQSMAKFYLERAGNSKVEGRRDPEHSTFVKNVVKSRAVTHIVKAR